MDFSVRPANVPDIPHLAHALLEASGGLIEAVYEGAIPGRDTHLIVEHLFSRPETTTSYAHCWVAEASDRVLGSIHAFPMDDMGKGPSDPLAREDRLHLYAPFARMHAEGSFYLMALAVYPEFRGCGIGQRLMAEAESAARSRGFTETSFNVFAENHRAVRLYESLGYRECARQPVVGHERIRYGGDLLLMSRRLR